MKVRLFTVWLLTTCLFSGTGCHRSADRPTETTAVPGIQATLSTNVAHVGDLLKLTVTIPHPTNASPQPPDLSRGKEVVVRDVKLSTLPTAGGQAVTRFDYSLTSFVVTNLVISTNAIRFLRSDGTSYEEPFPWVTL